MTLNEYVASKKLELLEALLQGANPAEGQFDPSLLAQGRVKGKPQMGATRYTQDRIILEFIFSDPKSSATVFLVTLQAPERIVFLPVPDWVVESIWHGEVDGSYHFVSHVKDKLDRFHEELTPEGNAKWFGPRPARRRE